MAGTVLVAIIRRAFPTAPTIEIDTTETAIAVIMTVATGAIGENRETGARIVGNGAANSHANQIRVGAIELYAHTYCTATQSKFIPALITMAPGYATGQAMGAISARNCSTVGCGRSPA